MSPLSITVQWNEKFSASFKQEVSSTEMEGLSVDLASCSKKDEKKTFT